MGLSITAKLRKLGREWPTSGILNPTPSSRKKSSVTSIREISTIAAAKNLLSMSRTISLPSLVELTLEQRLTSTSGPSVWTSPSLPSPDQLQHSGITAWLSLQVYMKLINLPDHFLPLDSTSPTGTEVSIVSGNTHVVASAILAPKVSTITESVADNRTEPRNINVTPSRAVVEVQKVFAPKFSLGLHHKTLGEMPAPPFFAVVSRSQLRLHAHPPAPSHILASSDLLQPKITRDDVVLSHPPPMHLAPLVDSQQDEDMLQDADSDSDSECGSDGGPDWNGNEWDTIEESNGNVL